jgi:hypothetical protein
MSHWHPAPLVIFEIGSRFIPGSDWTAFFFMLLVEAGMTGAYHHA